MMETHSFLSTFNPANEREQQCTKCGLIVPKTEWFMDMTCQPKKDFYRPIVDNLKNYTMKKQELQDQIDFLTKQVAELKSLINKDEKVEGRWKPQVDEFYFTISNSLAGGLKVQYIRWCNDKTDNDHYLRRNVFRTEDEAQKQLDKDNLYYELMDYAEELNNGVEIDWNSHGQDRYYIYFSHMINSLDYEVASTEHFLNYIYCLDQRFLEKAIAKFTEERLIELFK